MPIVFCSVCKKEYFKSVKKMNEAIKYNWEHYCSRECLSKNRRTGSYVKCFNDACSNIIYRSPGEKSARNFCSNSCSAHINNSIRLITTTERKNKIVRRRIEKITTIVTNKCLNISCGKSIPNKNKFCSTVCQRKFQRKKDEVYREEIITKINEFYRKNQRIPYKRECYGIYKPARNIFGGWNKAIEAAGLKPNSVIFSNKHIAKDGHKCDSLAERIIDDWLYKHGIEHEIHVFYPGQKRYTVDFLIGNIWLEFFGMYGDFKRYTNSADYKIQLAKQLNLDLIKVYPKDLFPVNRLEKLLKNLE